MTIMITKVQGWLRQKKIYTDANRPDGDDQQFGCDSGGGVSGDVRECVVHPAPVPRLQ